MEVKYIIEICAALDIAILSIAYPIFIDKISTIGISYNSKYLMDVFNYEFSQRPFRFFKKISYFQFWLYLSLISLLFLIFSIPPPFGWNNFFINNSAKFFAFICTFFLVINFIIWVNKILKFNGRSTVLVPYLIRIYIDGIKDFEKREYYLKTLNEITYHILKSQDEHLQRTLLGFYNSVFFSFRKDVNNKEVEYPIELYQLVYKINYEIAKIDDNLLGGLEHRAVSGYWLTGDGFSNSIFSNETFEWLWRNVCMISNDGNLLKMFWGNSHQYISYSKNCVTPMKVYDLNSGSLKESASILEIQNLRFREFHIALGGLMCFNKNYEAINIFFKYTQSSPPEYPLLFSNMDQIFQWYLYFRNPWIYQSVIDSRYVFPSMKITNIGDTKQVGKYVKEYIVCQFIRLFKLTPFMTFHRFTEMPNLNIYDNFLLTELKKSLDEFSNTYDRVFENESLINILGFDSILKDKDEEIRTFIDNLREEINNQLNYKSLEAEIDDNKKKLFNKSSRELIVSSLSKYKEVYEEYKYDSNDDLDLIVSANGILELMPKSAFTNSEVSHLNFDSILASWLVANKIPYLSNVFFLGKSKSYILNSQDLLKGIKTVVSTIEDYLVFGIGLSFEVKELLLNSDYKDDFRELPAQIRELSNSIYIINKDHLPVIQFNDLEKEKIHKDLDLHKLDGDFKLYYSIIDINKPENSKHKLRWKDRNLNEELMVQVALSFLVNVYLKKDTQIIQIGINSEFLERGVPNLLSDIKPFQV